MVPVTLYQSHMANLKPTNCKCPGGIDISVFLSDCKRRHVSWKQTRIVFKRLTNVPEITRIAALNMVTRTWLGQPIHLRVGMTDYFQHQSSVNPHGWFGTNWIPNLIEATLGFPLTAETKGDLRWLWLLVSASEIHISLLLIIFTVHP